MRIAFLIATIMAWTGIALGQSIGLPVVGTTTESLGLKSSDPGPENRTRMATEGKRAWAVVPSLTVQETITDNVALGSGSKSSDQVTEVVPSVRIEASTARLKMHLDYAVRGQYYAQRSQSATQNTLNAFGTLEAIENMLFLDMSGVIAQQSISAFGPQSTGTYSINTNSTETANFRISPVLRGRLGTLANYDIRYTRSMLRAKSTAASDADVDDVTARIYGNTPLAALGWSLDASSQKYDYPQGRSTDSDRWRGFLTYRFNPQFKTSASVGSERNDYVSLSKQSWNTHGYGLDWIPTERSQVSAFREKRFFGNGHNVTVTHRLPRSAIKYLDSKDVTALPSQLTTVGLGTIYDLLFFQLSSSIPDPVQRAVVTNALLGAMGIPPGAQIVGEFLRSQATVQRRQELAWLLQGARNMVTVGIVRSQNDFLGTAPVPQFSVSSSIAQKGFNVGWSHQLSGLTALNVTGSQMRSDGAGTSDGQRLKQNSLSAGVTTKLGPKTSAALMARRTETVSTINPYSENAVVGSVSVQF